MIDTHCHLTFDGLSERADEVIAAAKAAGVDRMISVGTTPADGRAAVAIAREQAGVFATTGIHPLYVSRIDDLAAAVTEVAALLDAPEVVAIGEMGLDRHYGSDDIDRQREAFQAQLALLADRPGLPAIIHNREATDETVAEIRNSGVDPARFVFHCFAGTLEELEKILDLGAWVSFTGIATFNNAPEVAAAAERVPLDRIMVETDAPFLTPAPHRKVKPNEPKFVVDVARFIAERRGMDPAEFEAVTDANAERFFRLPAEKG
ncbi:MAG: TatD family hydrolase [Phycisphaeraceae bacterium]|nr:TatD family hydrolase [Phycisphaeraceae bacterium]